MINFEQYVSNVMFNSLAPGKYGNGFNTLRPRQNGRHFPDDIFKCIFLKENILILITFSLKFVLRGPINNIPILVPIMAWRRPGDKPLSEPMMASLLTHICVNELNVWCSSSRCIKNHALKSIPDQGPSCLSPYGITRPPWVKPVTSSRKQIVRGDYAIEYFIANF